LEKNRIKVHNINRSNIRKINSEKTIITEMLNLLGRCFQEDFFEFDPTALPNDIFIWQAARLNS